MQTFEEFLKLIETNGTEQPEQPEEPEKQDHQTQWMQDYAQRTNRSIYDPEVQWIYTLIFHDPEVLPIYADWLEERGDRRADIIRRFVALSERIDETRANAYVKELEQMLGARGYRIITQAQNTIPGIYGWFKNHPEVQEKILQHGLPQLDEETLERILPHGSGIDATWYIDDEGDHWAAHNSYHLMNENGMYVGWADFTVTIPKNDPLNFEIQFEDEELLDEEGFGLDEYLSDSIHYALDSHFHGR